MADDYSPNSQGAAVRRLIDELVRRSRDGRISEQQWRAILTDMRLVGTLRYRPTTRQAWYELFGIGSQNATKYLGAVGGTPPSKPIGTRHTTAIHRVLATLKWPGLLVAPVAPAEIAGWLAGLFHPQATEKPDLRIHQFLRTQPETRALLESLYETGLAALSGLESETRFEKAMELARHGFDESPQRIVLTTRDYVPVKNGTDKNSERDFSVLFGEMLALIARSVSWSNSTEWPSEDWRRLCNKWSLAFGENAEPTRSPEQMFYNDLLRASRWPLLSKAVADHGSEIRNIDLLIDIAYLIRPLADGVIVLLIDVAALLPAAAFVKTLFARDHRRRRGPVLLVTSNNDRCLDFVKNGLGVRYPRLPKQRHLRLPPVKLKGHVNARPPCLGIVLSKYSKTIIYSVPPRKPLSPREKRTRTAIAKYFEVLKRNREKRERREKQEKRRTNPD